MKWLSIDQPWKESIQFSSCIPHSIPFVARWCFNPLRHQRNGRLALQNHVSSKLCHHLITQSLPNNAYFFHFYRCNRFPIISGIGALASSYFFFCSWLSSYYQQKLGQVGNKLKSVRDKVEIYRIEEVCTYSFDLNFVGRGQFWNYSNSMPIPLVGIH